MATFSVIRDGTVVEDSVFDVDPVAITSNPFGNFAVVKMDDRGGELFDEYSRGTRIDISVDPDDNTLTISSGETVTTDSGATDTYSTVNNGGTYSNQGTVEAGTGTIDGKFTGYVVEPRESEQSGADVLEVEAYSFDQFLRRNTVSEDQTGNLISEALQSIAENDTPVTYNAANIEVGDDQELTRSYRGEPVENVLRDLAFKSNNEEFGVDDNLEFFFRPRETTHIDRGIDDTQWFNYDIPELGKETINEVEVWFDDGEESVIVDDGTDKLDLQDSLDLPEPGTQRAELQRPLITDINDAEDIGRKYLAFRNSTLSGTVTTFGLYDAEPGDTIDVTIAPRGIDEEFVIASTEFRWGRDETILTIVERRGDVDDILTEINDSVQRQEMSGANRDAPKNRITTTNATGIVSITADADGNTPDADRFVNGGRNAVRDTWTGDSPPDITTLVVGDDNAGLSRSNTALVNQTNSATVSQNLPDAKSVEFSASITQTGVEEIGLETSGGTLIMRATFDTAVDLNGTVTVTLTVSNDDSVSRGVLTNDGQTAVRDILADNVPDLPADYAYGDDGTAVAESDAALGNELVSVSLDEVLLQNADTQTQWNNILTGLSDTDPIVIDSTGPQVAQSCFTVEGEDSNTESGTPSTRSDGSYSGGSAATFGTAGQARTWDFSLGYDIPAGSFEVAVRWTTNDSTVDPIDGEWRLDGDLISGYSPADASGPDDPDWQETVIATSGTGSDPGRVEAGDHTLQFECTGASSISFVIDVVAPYDTRFAYFFDNDNGGSSGYLDGPELFPDVFEVSLDTARTRRNVTEANFDLTANDVSGNFFVELANDGSTFTTVNNSQTGSVTFASADSGVDTNIGLGRYGTRTGATPLTGHLAQQIDDWQLFANPDAVVADGIGAALTRGVVSPGTLAGGTTIREAGIKDGSVLLTRHLLAEFDLLSGQRLASSETTRFTSDN